MPPSNDQWNVDIRVLKVPENRTAVSREFTVRDAVRERRSIRYFLPRAVAEADIRDLLRDTVWAPSPHNSQPWRFTVLLSPHTKVELADAMGQRLVDELCAGGTPREDAEQQAWRSRRRITGAPVVVLCSIQRDGLVQYPDARLNALEWEMAVQSVGAALQTLFLLAHERGLGACWMAAPMYCPDAVRSALDLPADFHPQALVLLGYPAKPGRQRDRRPLDAVIQIQ